MTESTIAMELGAGEAGGDVRFAGAALGLVLAVLALGAAYALAVPVGEAPDEPAHLAYVGYLLSHHALPPLAAPPYGDRYESHQAPLDYVAMALAASALGIHSLAPSFRPNPAFSFFRQGSRAFLPGGVGDMAGSIRALRLAHLAWAGATAALVLLTAGRLAGGRLDLALAATAPFVLSPQFLFVSATVNNDGAVTTLSAIALLALVQLLDANDAERPPAAAALLAGTAGTAAGLAPFAKVSGFLLLVPLAFAALVLVRRRAYRPAVLLLAAAAFFGMLWIGLTEWRFGTLFPPLPSVATRDLGASRVLSQPRWLGSLWLSFWAKLGWLNLHLPAAAYCLFLPPTGLVVIGGLGALGEIGALGETGALGSLPDRRPGRSTTLRERRPDRWPAWLLLATVGANLLLVAVYLARIDWQPQGRYLFPSLPALAGLAALGLRALGERLSWRPPLRRGLAAFLVLSALAMSLLGITVVARAYSQ